MVATTKNVLITGVSVGIGRATAAKFLSEGWHVYGTFLNSAREASDLKSTHDTNKVTLYGPYDFRNLDDTESLLRELSGVEFDAVVLNAGMFSEHDDFMNFELEEFNETMNCNFYTPLLLGTKLQHQIKNGGSLVIMSSNDAASGAYSSMSYCISKSALLSLCKCLCVNYGRRNIRVNSVAPGSIDTGISTPEQEFDAPKLTPIDRNGQPNEVADVIYFLSSEAASFVNGENITIDGGYSDVSVLLKKEASRIRNYRGYDYLIDMYSRLKTNDKVIHISPCPDYTWLDTPTENAYQEACIKAEKNGLEFHRIFVVPNDRIIEFQTSKIIKKYLRAASAKTANYFVANEEVKSKLPAVFTRIGQGYGVFNNDIAFIDTLGSDGTIGYVLESPELIAKLQADFGLLRDAIESGNIAQLKV